MAALPESSEWTRAVYPVALPFMVKHQCFDYCLETPSFELRYLPSPCVCSTPGPPISPWSASLPGPHAAGAPTTVSGQAGGPRALTHA